LFLREHDGSTPQNVNLLRKDKLNMRIHQIEDTFTRCKASNHVKSQSESAPSHSIALDAVRLPTVISNHDLRSLSSPTPAAAAAAAAATEVLGMMMMMMMMIM